MTINKTRKNKKCDAKDCPDQVEYFVNYGGNTADLCGSHTSIVKNADDSEQKLKEVLDGDYRRCEINGCERPGLWDYKGKKLCVKHYGNI